MYTSNIYNKYTDLLNSGKTRNTIDNYDLAKIFEYYSCLKIKSKNKFLMYDDICPDFKEKNNLSKRDTGIDICNLVDSIGQCKLRNANLQWSECGTFFGSQNVYSEESNKIIVKWPNMVIARNAECNLSKILVEKNNQKLFSDVVFNRDDVLNFCDLLIKNPPDVKLKKAKNIKLRNYQVECIDLILKTKKNVCVNLPTGTGKNTIIINSIASDNYYLILVPKIVLMDQLVDELVKHDPKLRKKIQCIGNGNKNFNENKCITICVYNSIDIITKTSHFNKIFIDEAHHVYKPNIYKVYEDNDNEDNKNENDEDDNTNADEDEDKTNQKYLAKIFDLQKYKNNVYLSATIDKINSFDYYSKDIREMIINKYLVDYIMNIPIFSNDPTNKNICKYLIEKYRSIILYCNTQKEGREINKIMNDIQNKCCEYVDCSTSKSDRDRILKNFKDGTLPFVVNVKILVEGFDAPITKGICFIHMPSSKTTLIQIIGRALRLHEDKTYAQIILPYSCDDDGLSINTFLKIMSSVDSRIRQSYISKKLGGYIEITNVDTTDASDESNKLVEYRYDMVYNSLGELLNNKEVWQQKLKSLGDYITLNKKRPSSESTIESDAVLGRWTLAQLQNYKNNKHIMKNNDIRQLWEKFIEEFKEYFESDEEVWLAKLDELKKFIIDNNKKPSDASKDNKIKILGQWLHRQIRNYKENQRIMKIDNVKKLWKEFIDENEELFLTEEEIWDKQLEKVITYIKENRKGPTANKNNKEGYLLNKWIVHQFQNIENNKGIITNDNIKKKWDEFIEKYRKYIGDRNFMSAEDIWKKNLEEIKDYIKKNDKLPPIKDYEYLRSWISKQSQSYKNTEQIMKDPEIRKLWESFCKQYGGYFRKSSNISNVLK